MPRLASLTALLLLAFSGAIAQPQPYVFYRGVVNAASFVPPGLPGGAIAQGSIFSIFGRNLGPASPAGASFPLTPALAGVSVEVCTGASLATCAAALPLFVSAAQINAVMPSNAPLGKVSLRVRNGTAIGNWIAIDVAASSPGIFAVNSGGFGPAIVQNYVSPTELPLNSLSSTARPGQALIVYATGFGPSTAPDNLPAPGGTLATPIEVFLGDRLIRPDYSGRAPGFSGLDQLNITVPAGTPQGCYVPLRVRANGRTVSNTVTVAIHPSGERCSDPHNPLTAPLTLGQRFFGFLAHRVETSADVDPVAVQSFTSEGVTVNAIHPQASDFHYSLLSLPPLGTCTTLSLRGTPLSGGFSAPFAASPALNLGPNLQFLAAGRSVAVPAASGGLMQYFSQLGVALSSAAGFLFGGGNLALSGAATGTVATQPPLNWTNRSTLRRINRSQPLTLQWSGGLGPDEIAIVAAIAEDLPQNASSAFLCAVDSSAGSFSVPTHVLANLPSSRSRLWEFPALLFLGRVPARASTLTAPGTDFAGGGFAAWLSNTAIVEGGN